MDQRFLGTGIGGAPGGCAGTITTFLLVGGAGVTEMLPLGCTCSLITLRSALTTGAFIFFRFFSPGTAFVRSGSCCDGGGGGCSWAPAKVPSIRLTVNNSMKRRNGLMA